MKCKHLAENCTCTLQPIQADCPYPDKSCADVSTRPNPVPRFVYDELKAQRDELLAALKDCANSLASTVFNYDGRKLSDIDPHITESTHAATQALISERYARAAIAKCEAKP